MAASLRDVEPRRWAIAHALDFHIYEEPLDRLTQEGTNLEADNG